MYYYQIYGLLVISDLEMPRLLKANASDFAADQQLTIHQDVIPTPYDQMPVKSFQYTSTTGFLSNDGCSLLIKNGNEICYRIKPHPYADSLVSYILGFGLAMLFLQRKMLAFHCSAVCKNGKAILIGGASGSGKSTITNALLQNGYHFMSDDLTVVDPMRHEQPVAYPAFPYQKLCRDVVINRNLNIDQLEYINEKKDKFLVPVASFDPTSAPVSAMIHLTVSDRLPIDPMKEAGMEQLPPMVYRRLSGLDTWDACKQALFLHAIVADHLHEEELAVPTLRFSSACPMYHIMRRDKADSTAKIVELIDKIINI